MTKWLRLASLAGLLVVGLAPAAAPPPRRLAVIEIERLIEQLGDRNFALRDRAERRLRAEGVPALPYLIRAVGHPDAEVRRRALRLVPGLEHAAVVAPKRISLIVKNQTLGTVLAELSKQSGYKVLLMGDNAGMGFPPGAGIAPAGPPGGKGKKQGTRYSFTLLNVTFWEAIERICRDTNLVVSQAWGDEAVRLQPANGFAPHVGQDGAFRYSANSIQLARNVDLSTSNPSMQPGAHVDNLTFNFQVFCEPRLPFLGMGEIRLDAAYDSERNSMLPGSDNSEMEMGGRWGGMRINRRYYGGGNYKQMFMQPTLSLLRTSQKATTIKTLRGVLPVTLLVEQKPMAIAEKVLTSKGKKTRIGDLEFNIEAVTKKANKQVEIRLAISNKGNVNDYNWMNNIFQRIELLDAKGGKYQIFSTNWGGNNGTSMTVTMGYSPSDPKMGEAERFVFQHWITRQHDIHFAFKDVPLP